MGVFLFLGQQILPTGHYLSAKIQRADMIQRIVRNVPRIDVAIQASYQLGLFTLWLDSLNYFSQFTDKARLTHPTSDLLYYTSILFHGINRSLSIDEGNTLELETNSSYVNSNNYFKIVRFITWSKSGLFPVRNRVDSIKD